MNTTARFLRYFVDDIARVEACSTHGAAVERARRLLLEANGPSFVAIFAVDPRLHPEAKPVATRLR